MTAHEQVDPVRCDAWGTVDESGHFWLARCSCGWQATNTACHPYAAFAGHAAHVVAAATPPVDPDQIEMFP